MNAAFAGRGPAPAAVAAPTHVALIMDGNGRWARARGLPRAEGHRAGAEAAVRAVNACREFGVRYLTLFAFSTENWGRPAEEVGELLDLFRARLDAIDENMPPGVRLRFVGDRVPFDPSLRGLMEAVERRTGGGGDLLLSVAVNYGGRTEIVQAVRRLARRAANGELDPEEIDEAVFAGELSAGGVPDPDLVIRTAGEQRLSNFLLWQSAYAELVFLDRLWPDFDRAALVEAFEAFAARERRFGRVGAA